MKNHLLAVLITGLSLGTAWAVRGQFGHEQGAAWAGAIGAMTMVLVSGRSDWYNKILTVALGSAVGWGAGGMISYGMVVGFGRSDDFPNALYGLSMLFVIGGLFGLLGGGLTGLALENSEAKKVKWGGLMAEMTAGGIISYYLLIRQFGILMTPPRSEAWAVCFGAGITMIWHMARNNFRSALRVALITTIGAGFGFASGNFLQILGNILEIKFNMWNVMEYSIGFFGGTSLAYGVFTSSWPEKSARPEKWENISALLFIFLFIPLIVFSKSFMPGKLAEKFSGSIYPEKIALISSVITAIMLVSAFLVAAFIFIRKHDGVSSKDSRTFLVLSLFTYIAASYIVSGAFAGIFMLNHHLYLVNFILILVLVNKKYPAFNTILRSELNTGRWFLALSAALVIIIILTATLVNLHAELPGAHNRF